MGHDGVLGHFSVLNGQNYQPLLPESSALFCAVVKDDTAALEKQLAQDPALSKRQFNVLEWSSDGKPESTDSSSISVKQRHLLHIAALSNAVGVAQLLLAHGADPLVASPDGLTPLQVRKKTVKSDIRVH
jgi:hypothetical protein